MPILQHPHWNWVIKKKKKKQKSSLPSHHKTCNTAPALDDNGNDCIFITHRWKSVDWKCFLYNWSRHTTHITPWKEEGKKKNERGGRECSPNMVTYRGMSTRQTDHHGGKNEKNNRENLKNPIIYAISILLDIPRNFLQQPLWKSIFRDSRNRGIFMFFTIALFGRIASTILIWANGRWPSPVFVWMVT